MFVLLASLVLGACSSDDDNNVNDPKNAAYTETTVTEAPAWQIDWSNNQERPNWTEPDGSLYANWTILKVQIEDALKTYASDGDLMALFVNGEIRALAKPAVSVGGGTATGKFLMKAYGNETGSETVNMSLQYYSSTLKHLFTLTDNITLDADVTTGIDEAFVPVGQVSRAEDGGRGAAPDQGGPHPRQWQHGSCLRGRRVSRHGVARFVRQHPAAHLRSQRR